jgi:hypothetical protein
MPTIKIMGEWDGPEPNEAAITAALMQQGVYDIDIDMNDDSNPHGWGI